MNVASLELCRTLHELSGWDDEDLAWWHAGDTDENGYKFADLVSQNRSDSPISRPVCPAYDLGYLIRKLPKQTTVFLDSMGKWVCTYVPGDSDMQIADTPEDAACKLAIELFKQGILQPNENDGRGAKG